MLVVLDFGSSVEASAFNELRILIVLLIYLCISSLVFKKNLFRIRNDLTHVGNNRCRYRTYQEIEVALRVVPYSFLVDPELRLTSLEYWLHYCLPLYLVLRILPMLDLNSLAPNSLTKMFLLLLISMIEQDFHQVQLLQHCFALCLWLQLDLEAIYSKW